MHEKRIYVDKRMVSIPSGGLPLLGNVGALKLYNSAIDASEITSVENLLITKFGI